jgi:hypothetical protein
MGSAFKSEMNVGLGLRWVAALANLAPYFLASESQHHLIKERFAGLVKSRAREIESVCLHPDDDGDNLVSSAIIPLTVLDAKGRFASLAEAQKIQSALRSSRAGPICHVGQPVRVGPRTVLRVGASALDIGCVSEQMREGQSLDQALARLIANLDAFFAKWSKIDELPNAPSLQGI